MALICCGIDEAGYGPMLGPLCVGLACFRVHPWAGGQHAPDLWDTLASGVCRSLKEHRADKRHRVVIADSKQLKLSNQAKNAHPLTHLERAALALLATTGVRAPDDHHLLGALGARLPTEAWYAGEPIALPLGSTAGEIAISSNVLASAMESSGVSIPELACGVVGEAEFNRIVRAEGTKAEATVTVIGQHLRTIERLCKSTGDDVRIVCDRLGARMRYADLIERELPGTRATPLLETNERSIYRLEGWHGDARIMFEVDSESAHMAVACASILAKLTRELAMARFNRHFSALLSDLRPTAGYYSDARRWLGDAKGILDPEARKRLVRLG